MRDPFRMYDQWKTASPYDDEPDILAECSECAHLLRQYIDDNEQPSDMPQPLKALLGRTAATLDAAAEWIEEVE